ncbi:hypothetical protein HHK36_029386 [Tetracentron sinense]|uniref:CASP-like protein n=1 Tax=Tetracentron sinense TaxID=13715 RepID=A0A835CZB2_TETSI|nr:hypothetical protein HHK36_029386 [Tetracentron sinense]
MESVQRFQTKVVQNPPRKSQKLFFIAQISLRILAVVATFAATWIMVTSKQSKEIFGIKFAAKYSYSSAFQFFAGANAAACVFSLLSLVLVSVLSLKGSRPGSYFFLLLHDMFLELKTCFSFFQILMVLLMAGCAAATAIGFVGLYGNNHTGWMAICNEFGKFCNRLTVSVAFSYLSFLIFFILTVMSANKSRLIQLSSY